MHKNPCNDEALTTEDIVPGLRFVWFTPGRSGSVERGIFLSKPYEDPNGDQAVDIRIDDMGGGHRSYDLGTLGITPTPQGTWLSTYTIAE